MSERTLGIIPARGGSKRVPNKNLRTLGGKPLIAHTIDQAERADNLDRTIVSTEDEDIKRTAEEWGGEVPFVRPEALATDEATNDEVVAHTLEWFEGEGERFDYVCTLPVTTPFRERGDIDGAIEKLHQSDGSSLVGVTTYDAPPFWAVETEQQELRPYFDQNPWQQTRTQEFPTLSHPNGAIFAADVAAFEESQSFYTDSTLSYEMPRKRSLDIDEPFDLELARALMAWRER